ncbi:MAG: alpha/beta hydrolase [Gammaproteobacteria bacterium]|nr:alpha/beta hydrolase [Gammaproteobacteria bacterium]
MTVAATEEVLIVPGYQGSGESHWQCWLHAQLPASRMLDDVDWHKPVLADWAEKVREEIALATQPLWIVAHSFGCLATAVAVVDRPQSVAGVIFVAPADPERFNLLGLGSVDSPRLEVRTLADVLRHKPLEVPGLLIASENDPWLTLEKAQYWATIWGLELHNAGHVGHINTESGFGPWPQLLDILSLQQNRYVSTAASIPGIEHRMSRGRGSLLAKVRRHTRTQLSLVPAGA